MTAEYGGAGRPMGRSRAGGRGSAPSPPRSRGSPAPDRKREGSSPPPEAKRRPPAGRGVGAVIVNAADPAEEWGVVVEEEETCWRLESGRIAKKASAGSKWMWKCGAAAAAAEQPASPPPAGRGATAAVPTPPQAPAPPQRPENHGKEAAPGSAQGPPALRSAIFAVVPRLAAGEALMGALAGHLGIPHTEFAARMRGWLDSGLLERPVFEQWVREAREGGAQLRQEESRHEVRNAAVAQLRENLGARKRQEAQRAAGASTAPAPPQRAKGLTPSALRAAVRLAVPRQHAARLDPDVAKVRRLYEEARPRLPPWNQQRADCCGQDCRIEDGDGRDRTVKLRFNSGFFAWFPKAAVVSSPPAAGGGLLNALAKQLGVTEACVVEAMRRWEQNGDMTRAQFEQWARDAAAPLIGLAAPAAAPAPAVNDEWVAD
eukprot:TRINITY_DN30289_c0_g1_i1.p1 TRINITY_DN30289_c0_g1~~TRINITY_DN30289_c0_g1_i1.p1  ORF type:complete len:452 (+),score=143.28 TRINITY_DN30289_c0_g1_i1:66-1358(+)